MCGSKIQRFLQERNIFSTSLDAGRTAGHRTSQFAWCCGGGVFGVSVEMHMMAKTPIDPSLESNRCDCRVLNFAIWFRTKCAFDGFLLSHVSGCATWQARKLLLLQRPLPVTFARMPGRGVRWNENSVCKLPWTILRGGQWVLDPCAVEESLGASVSLCFLDGRWLVFHQAPILGQMLVLKSSRYSRFKL